MTRLSSWFLPFLSCSILQNALKVATAGTLSPSAACHYLEEQSGLGLKQLPKERLGTVQHAFEQFLADVVMSTEGAEPKSVNPSSMSASEDMDVLHGESRRLASNQDDGPMNGDDNNESDLMNDTGLVNETQRERTISLLIQIALRLSSSKTQSGTVVEPVGAVSLIGDWLQMETIYGCERAFSLLESWAGQGLLAGIMTTSSQSPRLMFIRLCNALMRRLSRSDNTAFCGRILMLLAYLFSIDEKSGVNLAGAFHSSNVTTILTPTPTASASASSAESSSSSPASSSSTTSAIAALQELASAVSSDSSASFSSSSSEPGHAAVDMRFYRTFWRLQRWLAYPLLLEKECDDFVDVASKVFTVLEASGSGASDAKSDSNNNHTASTSSSSSSSSSSGGTSSGGGKGSNGATSSSSSSSSSSNQSSLPIIIKPRAAVAFPYFPKYLTSPTLLPLQLHDKDLRRAVLTQVVVALTPLVGPDAQRPKPMQEHAAALSRNRSQLAVVLDRAWNLLQSTSPQGPAYAKDLRVVLERREARWRLWKADGCRPISLKSADLTAPITDKAHKTSLLKLLRASPALSGSTGVTLATTSTRSGAAGAAGATSGGRGYGYGDGASTLSLYGHVRHVALPIPAPAPATGQDNAYMRRLTLLNGRLEGAPSNSPAGAVGDMYFDAEQRLPMGSPDLARLWLAQGPLASSLQDRAALDRATFARYFEERQQQQQQQDRDRERGREEVEDEHSTAVFAWRGLRAAATDDVDVFIESKGKLDSAVQAHKKRKAGNLPPAPAPPAPPAPPATTPAPTSAAAVSVSAATATTTGGAPADTASSTTSASTGGGVGTPSATNAAVDPEGPSSSTLNTSQTSESTEELARKRKRGDDDEAEARAVTLAEGGEGVGESQSAEADGDAESALSSSSSLEDQAGGAGRGDLLELVRDDDAAKDAASLTEDAGASMN